MVQHPIENLVFLPDSPYSNWIIERSELVRPGLNVYFGVVEETTKTKFLSYPSCKIISQKHLTKNTDIGDLSKYKRIIVHFHNPFIGHFLWKNKSSLKGSKIIWVLWSGDLYKLPKFIPMAYSSKTLAYLGSDSRTWNWKDEIQHRILNWLGKPNMILHYKSFGLFNYIASPFEKDYLNACKYLKINPERLYFSFLSIEELFSEEILTTVPNPGKRIMVGHSGALENNHLDVFDTLGSIVKNQEIYCPLAYGPDSYIQKVKQAGNSTFQERFISQIEFLPKKEYYTRLTQIGTAIFNHKIQQAFGNIIALVFLGAKVYLNPENPIYFQLEKWGVKVYDYGKITSDELETPLSIDEINNNRKIIHKLFNEEQINSLYINLLSK